MTLPRCDSDCFSFGPFQLCLRQRTLLDDGQAVRLGARAFDLAEICRRLDGLPLAIELAAARVDQFAPRELASRLDQRFQILGQGRYAVPRQRSLRALLDWSCQRLPEAERRVLRRLAVFKGEFDLASATAVAAADDLSPSQACDAIIGLTAKSLLASEFDGNGCAAAVRYSLLETTRAYSLEALGRSGEENAVMRRLALRCEALPAEAEPDRGQLGGAPWLAKHGRRIDDLRAALAWGLRRRPGRRRVLLDAPEPPRGAPTPMY